TVVDAPVSLTMVPITPTEGITFNNAVATFTDANPFAAANSFSATINWGDGTPSTSGTIVADPNSQGHFSLIGSHVFADRPAVFGISVSLNDTATVGRPVASGSESISVLNAPPTPTISGPAFRFGGTSTFTISATDPSAADTSAGFLYSINWGDGTSPQT